MTTKASVTGKIIITGMLMLDSPLLIGQGGHTAEASQADIQVLRDGEGRPFIPGTSLAGVLRDFCEREYFSY